MAVTVGNYSLTDLEEIKFQSVKAFGLNTIQEIINREIKVHNDLMIDMVSTLAEVTTDALRIYGTSPDGSMVEVDEYGRAPTVKQSFGGTVGFPLRRWQAAIGWTSDWFERKTPADLAHALIAAELGHKKAVIDEVKKAIFRSANYSSRDIWVDQVVLSVKRLVNADGDPIPNGPYGLTFDGSTHTHYLANATLTTAALDAAITTIMEHGHSGKIIVAFNYANEATVRALTGFIPLLDPRILQAPSTATVPTGRLNQSDLYDRTIGIYGPAEIVIKPWVPANYAYIYDATGPKPLAFRQRDSASLQGLRIPAEFDAFPLHAQYIHAEFGIGVWNRTNGAVLRFNNGTYADPL